MIDQWALIYNAFNPYETVAPDKLDAWYVERPKSPLRALLVELRPEKDPTRFVLVGHPASGKSTELVKLGYELKERFDYLVVRIDLEQNIDIQKVNPIEALFLIGTAVHKVGHEELPDGKKPDRRLLESLKEGLEEIVTTYREKGEFKVNLEHVLANLVCAGAGFVYAGPLGAAAGLVAAPKVVQMVSKMVKFSSGTDEEIVRKREVGPKIEEMIRQVNAILEDVQQKSKKDLVLLVDGLDKPKEREVVKLNFEERPFLSELACRAVYIAPMWVAYHPDFGGVRSRFPIRPFPNIRVYDPKACNKPDKDGHATMQQVVHKRLNSLGLRPEAVLSETVLSKLIEGSGGLMRDLIRLVRDAATQAEIAEKDHIDEPEAIEALRTMYQEFDRRITPDYRTMLNDIHDKHERLNDPKCDELLHASIVLSYINDEVWWDAHAILWSEPWGNP